MSVLHVRTHRMLILGALIPAYRGDLVKGRKFKSFLAAKFKKVIKTPFIFSCQRSDGLTKRDFIFSSPSSMDG